MYKRQVQDGLIHNHRDNNDVGIQKGGDLQLGGILGKGDALGARQQVFAEVP